MNKKELIIFQANDGAIELKSDYQNDTIWANQKDISSIFNVERSVISKHIKSIFKNSELDENVVCAKFAHTAEDGKTYQTQFYNLDIILAVGYRTNSAKAIKFRIWANKIIKEHIVNGFTINSKQIERKRNAFIQAVSDIQSLSQVKHAAASNDVLELVKTFASTWFSLDSFDKNRLPRNGVIKSDIKVSAEKLYQAINELKENLISKAQASSLFAEEKRRGNLAGILGNIFQSAFGADIYPSIEEKASHLLYFIIKDHPFIDGNKRCAAFAFIWFLNLVNYNFSKNVTPQTLTTLALLIAQSDPKDKNKLISLSILLLSEKNF